MNQKIHELSATQLAKKIRDGDLSSQTVVTHYLDRIAQHDPTIASFLEIFPQDALDEAKKIDQDRAHGKPLGPLAGVPIAIKDNLHLKGKKTTCASKILATFIPPFEATVVSRAKAAGAIPIGKTNLDEFAMGSSTEYSAFQKTKNPWDLSCVPGGSSGGSAACVSAGLSPLALGSDTGGSVRQPASFCGISAFKPTYGMLSRSGLVAFGSSLDVVGPMARCAQDLALLMDVMGGHCPLDATSLTQQPKNYHQTILEPLKPFRVGVPWTLLDHLHEESRALFDKGLERLKTLGATIVPVDLSILETAIATYYILATAEASTNLARFDGIRYGYRHESSDLETIYSMSKEEGFGPEVKRRILLGTFVLSSGYKDAYYDKAQRIRTLIIQAYQRAFASCDLIASPVTPFSAFPFGSKQDPMQMYLEDFYTIGVNLGGVPAVAIPSEKTQEGKPMGIQLIGPLQQDPFVLRVAHHYEQLLGQLAQIPEAFR